MNGLSVGLQPLVSDLNLPTVIKTAIFPGQEEESLVIATQVGEIFYTRNNSLELLLDISDDIILLGTNRGYDERGLLGLAFHPDFSSNGLFYIYYSVVGSQGPGALSGGFIPDPCRLETESLSWTDRDVRYDHIDTLEEWILQDNGQPVRRRTLLSIRRPFMNHNGVNTLNFSPETGHLVLTTGDGGLAYDPFNLAQDNIEIAGKIVEIDVNMDVFIDDAPAITRFYELPDQIQQSMTVIAKGVRNITGIAYHRFNNSYIKYVGNVGQDLVESVFSFASYKPIAVTDIVQANSMSTDLMEEGLINLGWRGWEGDLPTSIINPCPNNRNANQKIIAYYEEAIEVSTKRIYPMTCFYHQDSRPGKFQGTALTGVQAYSGQDIPQISGSCVFTNWSLRRVSMAPPRGVLAYTWAIPDCKLKDYGIIDINYDFGSNPAYYTCLGANASQTRLYLGVYRSPNVTDFNLGAVYEIVRE